MLDDLALFVAIVDDGSLQAAARRLNLPAATLTRRLQKLEARLGCQLLLRSARSLKPTPEGQLYYEQCRPLLVALQQTTATLDSGLNQIQGTLRVLAPVSLARSVLAPAWMSFLAAWPAIRLELILDNRNEDLWRHGADLAVRVGPQHDPKLRQRRLGGIGLDVVAAPSYLAAHGEPRHPRELGQHALLVSEPLSTWYFTAPDGGEHVELRPQGRCSVNELELMVAMAEAGLGIMYCPNTLTANALASGRLRRVLAGWRTPERTLYAVWPQQQMPRKVRALLEHLSRFAQETPLLQCDDAAAAPRAHPPRGPAHGQPGARVNEP